MSRLTSSIGSHDDDNVQPLYTRAMLFVPGLYVVLLLSVIITVAVGVGLIYILLEWANRNSGGAVAWKFIVVLGIGVLVGIVGCVKGAVFAIRRPPGFQPALQIDLETEPRLRDLLEELCSRMNTELPDAVILHAQTAFFVQSGRLRVFDALVSGRVLSLSAPLLSNLTVNQFRAILAHEFAHFTGQDTVYSSRVLPVYLGAGAALRQMSPDPSASGDFWSGVMRVPLVIPRSILKTYLQTFHRINMRISRSREFRADAMACEACGTESFASALKRSAVWGELFEMNAVTSIMSELGKGKVYQNLYRDMREIIPALESIAHNRETQALAAAESEDASHPTLSQRLARAPSVPEQYGDLALATTLIENLTRREEELTRLLTQVLAVAYKVHPAPLQTESAEASA